MASMVLAVGRLSAGFRDQDPLIELLVKNIKQKEDNIDYI